MESSFELSTLGILVPQLVMLLVMIVGLVLALTQRARLGSAATALTVAATSLGAVSVLIDAWWQVIGIRTVYDDAGDARFTVISIVGLGLWLLHLAWIGLLLAAVFAGRRRPPVVQDAVLAPGSPL